MGELHADDRALRVDEVHDRRPRLGVLVAPDPGVLRGDAPLGHDGGRLGEDETEAAGRTGAEVDEMPGPGHAVLRFARVLTHRGEPDPVVDGQSAQRHRGEEFSHGTSLPE